MAVFSILKTEGEVQLNDKTRLDASRSFVSRDSADINSITIKPDVSTSAVECFGNDLETAYLDWAYTSFGIDVDSLNNDLNFKVGSTEYSATLTSGAYTLASYVSEVITKMNTAASLVFTSAISDNQVTITGPSMFQFQSSSVADQLFMDTSKSGTSILGGKVEYGIKVATCVVTDSDDATSTQKAYIKVFSEEGDRLFCEDHDLVAHEPDVLKWVFRGRSSHKNVYRRAQKLILAWIDEKGFVNVYGNKFDKHDIVDLQEVKQWATFMSLKIIFEGNSNAVDDVFSAKAKSYAILEQNARNRAVLRLDTNKDGVADVSETLSVYSGSIFRR